MAEVGADLGRRERQGAVNLGGEALVLQSGDLRPRESRARPGGGGSREKPDFTPMPVMRASVVFFSSKTQIL